MLSGREPIEWYEGDFIVFSLADPEAWAGPREATAIMIGGRRFWITADVLAKLAGKTLRVVDVNVSVGDRPPVMRGFLIPFAEALPEGVVEARGTASPVSRPRG